MASAYTYDSLVTALRNTTEDQGSEYLAEIPRLIALAEDRVLRDLDLELFDDTATSTFNAGSPWLGKPQDMVALRYMQYTGAAGLALLVPKTMGYITTYWPDEAVTTATPKYYAEYSDQNWFIGGTPDDAYPVTIRYIKRPDGLSSAVQETWLSTHVGDALLYAALVASEQFLKADERIPVWGADYADRIAKAKRELRFTDRSDYQPMESIPKKG